MSLIVVKLLDHTTAGRCPTYLQFMLLNPLSLENKPKGISEKIKQKSQWQLLG